MRLNPEQIDALTEVVNIGVGRAAASLHSLVERRIELAVPRVRVCRATDLVGELDGGPEPADTAVVQGFRGAITGRAILAFPRRSGVTLAGLLSDGAPLDDAIVADELDFDRAGILEEVGNIVLNGVLGSLANLFEDAFDYTVPELCTGRVARSLMADAPPPHVGSDPTCLIADARFQLADSEIGGALLLAFNTGELEPLLDRLLVAAGT